MDEIGILGTVHTDDLRLKLKYPLQLMEVNDGEYSSNSSRKNWLLTVC